MGKGGRVVEPMVAQVTQIRGWASWACDGSARRTGRSACHSSSGSRRGEGGGKGAAGSRLAGQRRGRERPAIKSAGLAHSACFPLPDSPAGRPDGGRRAALPARSPSTRRLLTGRGRARDALGGKARKVDPRQSGWRRGAATHRRRAGRAGLQAAPRAARRSPPCGLGSPAHRASRTRRGARARVHAAERPASTPVKKLRKWHQPSPPSQASQRAAREASPLASRWNW